LFKKMIDGSRLAGELGVLLRIEDGIATELHRAREQFVAQLQSTGFLPNTGSVPKQGALDLSGIDDDAFFHEAEDRIVDALRTFTETATGSANVRRTLFAGDAAQGIAFIDIVRTRFDVLLMTPLTPWRWNADVLGLCEPRVWYYVLRPICPSSRVHNPIFAGEELNRQEASIPCRL
jgi:hypothetical protein